LTDNYTLLAANDDALKPVRLAACINKITDAAPDDTVWIQVDGSRGGTTGTFTISLYDSIIITNTKQVTIANSAPISIYPNPARNEIRLLFNQETRGSIHIKLFNLQGELVASQIANNYSDTGLVVPWEGPRGVYIIQIHTNQHAYSRKILFQ
jgi:hypothetical protein